MTRTRTTVHAWGTGPAKDDEVWEKDRGEMRAGTDTKGYSGLLFCDSLIEEVNVAIHLSNRT